MDQSLRNHAMLVQHQNEQQQQQRQQRRAEEYYRNNHGMQIPPGGSGGGGGGVVRGSSSSQASGSNKSSRGSNSLSSGSKQSRASGSGSGKSTRSGTRNSGTAGSDDAIGGGLGASLAAHHNRDHRLHRQQQQQPHRQQQQQQYQQQQHGMTPQQYRQQLGTVPQHQQYQQEYQQQEQHYNNDSQPQQEQYLQQQYLQQQYLQQQYLQQQYEQQQQHEQQQQQHEQQQQYELQQQYEQQQLQQQYEQQQQQESQHYHGSYSSQISQSQYSQSQSQYSQQSQSQQSYYIDYQSQGGGGGQAGGTVQSHYSSIYGSVTGGASQAQQSQAQQSQASTARSAAVDEAYRRLGQKLSKSVHGDDISSASSARGQPHNRINQQAQQQQHPVRIGSVNNPSSVFVPYNKGAAVKQQEKEQRQKQQRATSEDDNGKDNVVRKLTANANDLFRLWHTEYQRTNPNTNTSNVKEQHQHLRRQSQSNQKQNHDSDHDVSSDRRAFAQMTLAGDGSSSSSNNNNNNNNTIGDAHNNNNNNNSSHHHIRSHNHNHNNHNSIYHQRRGSLSAVIESDSCTNKRSSSDSSNGRSRATNNTNINQRSTQSVGDGGRGDNDNSIIASSSIGTRASSIGTRTCNSSRSYNALPPPRGKCLTQPSEGVSGTNYNLCDNTEGNLIVYKNDTLSVPRKQVHVLNNKTNSNGGDDGSKIRQSGSGASGYTDFRVRSLLGQGTFAQVFKCLNSQTGKYVAVKIVKAKPAYTRQAAIEIDVIRALKTSTSSSGNDGSSSNTNYMVDMVCYFMYKDHLCLVFELLGMNLYEVLKKRQFRGLPLGVVQTMVRQAVLGARALGQKSIVHCDLKPENILLVNDDDAESVMSAGESKRTQVEETGKSAAATTMAGNSDGNDDASLSTITTTVMAVQNIKLIDFGSACFEGQMSHTYIQSRFYRSPEVLIGLAYDSAIDMWSLGCVAAELFLGLPILPGVHEHNQLGRISEMIGDTPDWMLDQGSKTSKFFVKFVPAPTPTPTPPGPSATNPRSPSPIPPESRPGSQPPRPLPQWRIKTQQEYIASLSQKDIKKKGGLTKLEKQPGNRYFKRTRLSDIVLDKGQSGKQEDVRLLQYFVHFLYGILDPDPWKRWTASQVVNHPFLTGATMEANTGPIKDDNQANIILNLYWEAPSDPTIYRRKLLNVQKTREKQQAARRGQHRSYSRNRSRSESPYSQDGLPTVRSVSSETLSVSSYSDEFTNQTAAGPQMRPGSYQMPSSMTQFGNNQGVQLAGYNSAAAGTQSIMYGPQSYSEAGNFAEVDFALALQRPGVVPTGPGDSVTTGSMTASTSATTMSSNNSRSTYHHTNLGSQSGSYGTHQVLHNGNHQQRRFPVATSRSFGEGDVTATSRVPAEIDSLHQQVVYASSHDSGIYIGPPPTDLNAENIPNNLPLAMSTPPAPPAVLGSTTQLPMQYAVPLNDSSAAVTSNNTGIQNPNMGNYDPQAYQQQLAMMQHQFQQQQILLQQQQAALALQQQQLEQYSMNQALMNPNIPNAAAARMNTGGAPAAAQGGGYYVVTADDGTSRLVAASNLGMAIPMSGQVAGIGAPGQIQGQGIATPNNQTTGDGFYTNNSNHQHQHPHQQP